MVCLAARWAVLRARENEFVAGCVFREIHTPRDAFPSRIPLGQEHQARSISIDAGLDTFLHQEVGGNERRHAVVPLGCSTPTAFSQLSFMMDRYGEFEIFLVMPSGFLSPFLPA